MFLKILYSSLLVFLLGLFFVEHEMNKTEMLVLLLFVLASLVVFILRKEWNPNLQGQFLKHSTIFLIGYCIVHFQYYIDYVIGNLSESNAVWINKEAIVKACILSFAGLTSFLLGYINFKKRSEPEIVAWVGKPIKTWMLLIFATGSLAAYFMTANRLYLAGFYGSENMGAEATYAILAFTILVFAIIIQNSRNMIITDNVPKKFIEYIKRQGILFSILIGIYLLSVVISGDRGPIITFGLAYISGYFMVTKKKLNWKVGSLFIIGGAAFISLLGIARSFDKNLDFNTKIAQGLKAGTIGQEESFLPQTKELAGSVKALHTTVNYVPNTHDFLYGEFQFKQLLVAVPFVAIFTPLIFQDQSYKYRGSASFVTWINQGDYPTSGEGTTCIADFYFDFGIVGVVAGMLLFGYLYRMAEVKMYSGSFPNLFKHSFLVVYLSFSLYIPRSSFLVSFKMVVWIFIVLFVNQFIFRSKSRVA